MAITARDILNDDTTDAGFDLVMDNIASLSGDVGLTKIMLGASGTDGGVIAAANPFPVEIFDVSGTLVADIGSIKTAVELIDNSIYVDDADWTATTSSHSLIGGIYQSSPGSITDGDTGPIRLDANGAVHIHDGGNTITVDGTVTANPASGTIDTVTTVSTVTAVTSLDKFVYVDDADWTATTSSHALVGGVYTSSARTITDGDTGPFSLDVNGHVITSGHADSIALADDVSNTANIIVDEAGAFVVQPTMSYMFDGSTWDRVRGDATDGMLVNLGTNNDVGLNAGTNSIGKLAANSGVDIGDVDVTSVIPGTGATNLGKAISDVVNATDTGVALLAKHKEDQIHLTTADGDYDILALDSLGSLHVNPESHHIFDDLDSATGWTVLSDDTDTLATTPKHVMGTAALSFNKVNGTANTIFAGIQKTLSSTDLGDVSPHDILQGSFYASSYADISYAFLRLGTDSTNYNEWRLDADLLTAGLFETGALTLGDADYTGITGNGMDSSAITYIALGMAFNAETDTLTGIIFDQVSYHTNQHTSTSINSEVTSSISSANVNVNKVGNKVVNTQAGVIGTGTQRFTLATNDVNMAAINATLLGGLTSPVIDSYNSAAVNLAAATANQEIVAAPGANKQIWVYAITVIANVAGSLSFQDEDDTAVTGVMPVAATGGFSPSPSGNFAMPLWKLATNKALECDTLTCTGDGSISYGIVDVS